MSDECAAVGIYIIHHSSLIISSPSSTPRRVLRLLRRRLRGEARGEARGDLGGELRVFDRDELPALAVAAHREFDGAVARLEGDGRGVAALDHVRSLAHAERLDEEGQV